MWFKRKPKKSQGPPLYARLKIQSVEGYANGNVSLENFIHRNGLSTKATSGNGRVSLQLLQVKENIVGKGDTLEDAATNLTHLLKGKKLTLLRGGSIKAPEFEMVVNK